VRRRCRPTAVPSARLSLGSAPTADVRCQCRRPDAPDARAGTRNPRLAHNSPLQYDAFDEEKKRCIEQTAHRIVGAGPVVTATTRVPSVFGGCPVLRGVGLFRSYGHPRVVHSARAAKSAGSVKSDVLISGACRHVLARVRTYLGWLAFTPHCVGQCSPPHPRLFAADTSDCIFTMRSNIFEEFPN